MQYFNCIITITSGKELAVRTNRRCYDGVIMSVRLRFIYSVNKLLFQLCLRGCLKSTPCSIKHLFSFAYWHKYANTQNIISGKLLKHPLNKLGLKIQSILLLFFAIPLIYPRL